MNDNTGYIIPFSGNSKKELEYYLNEVKRRLSSYNISLYNIQVILEVLSRKNLNNIESHSLLMTARSY